MRYIQMNPGDVFQEEQLNRTGAFNAAALTEATDIIEAVRTRGDEALREYTAKFDGVEIQDFRVSQEAIDAARAKVAPELREALQLRFATSTSARWRRAGSTSARTALW